MDGDSPSLLNVRETARRLGVHENTVRNWARSGVLPEARVPGSRFHRFRSEDVDRLIAQRGAAAPSLQSDRRTINPELVGANQLKQWPGARSRDAQENFPELVRRLLVETPGISNISVRSGDGVALAGFDGLAEAEKTAFLPAGHLAFEWGVEKDPARKATSDYEKRIREGRSDKTFVFITPHRWAGKSAWAEERRGQGFFQDVQTLDADDLEGWLKTAPAAHYWISEHLGLRPRDAQTLDTWWSKFSTSTDPMLPATLFVAGRASSSKQLQEQLDGAPKLIVIESEWMSDCLGFIYGSLNVPDAEQTPEGRSIVIVSAPEVWDRILEQPGQAILIPDFEGANVGAALDRGHHVISVVDRTSVSRRGVDIKLPRLDRRSADEALEAAGVDYRRADRLAVLARRSLPALWRQLSRNPRFSRPDWAGGADAAVLAPLVLLGAWTTSPEDLAAVEKLVGQDRAAIEETCRRLASTSDPVVRKVGSTWMFASPEEAFLLLRNSISQAAVERWREALLAILLEADPMQGLSPKERIAAQMQEYPKRCTPTLRRGLAQGMALMGAMGADTATDDGSTLAEHASWAVRDVLRVANGDQSEDAWELLAPALPLLAEAGPDSFLLALDEGLSGSDPVVLKLFREDEEGSLSLGPSSPHPHLLWAIETLTWSEEYFVEGVRALARLSELEPGGKSGNRPASSLATILCGWVPNTSASLEARLRAVDVAYEVSSTVGWQLIFDLWPSNHGWVMPPAAPHIRDDWRPTVTSVPLADWAAFAHGLVDRAIKHAGSDAGRLRKLISGLATISPGDRDRVLDHLEEQAEPGRLDDDARLKVWEKLQQIIARHRRFPDANWVMQSDVLDRLEALADQIEPASNPQRFAYLFDWHPDLPGVEQGNYEVYAAKLAELRDDALSQVLSVPDWADQLADIARRSKAPGQLGWVMAGRDEIDRAEVIKWLHRSDEALLEAGANYLHRRMLLGGPEWLETLLHSPDLTGQARPVVLRQVPPRADFWQVLVASPKKEDADVYWSTGRIDVVPLPDALDAIQHLISHGRAWTAITVAAYAIDSIERTNEPSPPDPPSNDVLLQLLEQARTQAPAEGEISQMTGYHLGQLLDHLTAAGASKGDVARFEFTFFRLTEHHREPQVLNQALASDPELFVDLVQRVYRGKNEPKRTKSEHESDLATQAWWVLRGWMGYPGRREDGTIDTAVMKDWVAAARLALSDADRGDIGDEMIGQAFAHSPIGSDEIWPAEPVRDLVETLGSRELENGLIIGRLNSRGVTTRGVYDGGKQEHDLAQKYRDWSARTKDSWPRTSRILRSISESYERDARRQDLEAELDADQR